MALRGRQAMERNDLATAGGIQTALTSSVWDEHGQWLVSPRLLAPAAVRHPGRDLPTLHQERAMCAATAMLTGCDGWHGSKRRSGSSTQRKRPWANELPPAESVVPPAIHMQLAVEVGGGRQAPGPCQGVGGAVGGWEGRGRPGGRLLRESPPLFSCILAPTARK